MNRITHASICLLTVTAFICVIAFVKGCYVPGPFIVDKGVPLDICPRSFTENQLEYLRASVHVYYKLHKSLPPDNVNFFTTLKKGQVAFLFPDPDMIDGWGNDIVYSVTNSRVRLSSAGEDELFGTKDDITVDLTLGGPLDGKYEKEIWEKSLGR